MKNMILAALLAAAVGCASGSGQSMKQGVTATAEQVSATYDGALSDLTRAVGSLSRLVEVPQADLAKAYEAYVSDLKSLDGRVAELRSLSTAIQAKRDEYLKHWVEKTSTISSPELKERAEKRRAELAGEFQTMAGKGAAVRRAYAPLHAAMQDVANYLESDLTPAAVQGLKSELESIRSMNVEVQKLSGEYRTSVQELRAKLAAAAPPPPAK